VTQVLLSGIPTTIAYYEQLERDPQGEIMRILAFINFRMDVAEARITCLRSEDFQLFKRARSNSTDPIFSSGLTNLINRAIRDVRRVAMTSTCDGCRDFPNYQRPSDDPDLVIDTEPQNGGFAQVGRPYTWVANGDQNV